MKDHHPSTGTLTHLCPRVLRLSIFCFLQSPSTNPNFLGYYRTHELSWYWLRETVVLSNGGWVASCVSFNFTSSLLDFDILLWYSVWYLYISIYLNLITPINLNDFHRHTNSSIWMIIQRFSVFRFWNSFRKVSYITILLHKIVSCSTFNKSKYLLSKS